MQIAFLTFHLFLPFFFLFAFLRSLPSLSFPTSLSKHTHIHTKQPPTIHITPVTFFILGLFSTRTKKAQDILPLLPAMNMTENPTTMNMGDTQRFASTTSSGRSSPALRETPPPTGGVVPANEYYANSTNYVSRHRTIGSVSFSLIRVSFRLTPEYIICDMCACAWLCFGSFLHV